MDNIEDVSVYYLLLELLDGGEVGLLPSLEPISEEVILSALKLKTHHDFGRDARRWAEWFIGNEEIGNETERANLLMFIRTQESMHRIWERIRPQKS